MKCSLWGCTAPVQSIGEVAFMNLSSLRGHIISASSISGSVLMDKHSIRDVT